MQRKNLVVPINRKFHFFSYQTIIKFITPQTELTLLLTIFIHSVYHETIDLIMLICIKNLTIYYKKMKNQSHNI